MKTMKLSELRTYEPHPIRKQMVILPSLNIADEPEDLEDSELTISKSLHLSIVDNGIMSPIIICGNTIVDGLRRLDVAKVLYSDDTEIPVEEISESDVLANVIAAITTHRKLTIQQRVFNIYQFVRADHLKCITYGEALQKSKLSGQNFNVAVPSTSVKTSGFNGVKQTDYFSKYLAERENNPEIKSPCVWLAERLGCVPKYLAALNKIWDYLESFDEETCRSKFNAAVSLVNIECNSLNTIIPSLKGGESERADLKDDPELQEKLKKQWVAKCKASFSGLAEKVKQKYLKGVDDKETQDALFAAMKESGFNKTSAIIMAKLFKRLQDVLSEQSE